MTPEEELAEAAVLLAHVEEREMPEALERKILASRVPELDDRLAAVRRAAWVSGATVLLKGHRTLIADALKPLGIAVMGAIPRDDKMVLPERHLGLVQAGEHADLDARLRAATAPFVVRGLVALAIAIPLSLYAMVNFYPQAARWVPYSPAWWACTFPPGTVSMGGHQTALVNGSEWLDVIALSIPLLLIAHWCLCSARFLGWLWEGRTRKELTH